MKICIVGGGLIGSYIAWRLCQKGHKVFVYEQKGRVGKLACSGLISERIQQFLQVPEGLIENKIKYANIHFRNAVKKIVFEPEMLVINRPELDRHVARQAQEAGARYFLGQGITEIPKGFDRVIACDGASSRIRSMLKIKAPGAKLGLLAYVEKFDDADFVDTWKIPRGFCWKIPRGKSVEYGLMSSPERAEEDFLEFCIKQNINPKQKFGALIPCGLRTSGKQNVALCGDAAGLTKPWSGGGVIWGLTAAELLCESFPDSETYNKACRKFFKWKFFAGHLCNSLAGFLGNNIPWLLPREKIIDADFLF